MRPATKLDIPFAARTLSSAFQDYSWTRWSVPADDHGRRLEELYTIYLLYALEHGVVVVDHEVHGVAALVPAAAPGPCREARSRIGELHGDRFAALSSVELPAPPLSSWDFAALGVQPERRGNGLGSALIAAALARVDEEAGAPLVTLETSDERNVRLYARHGFTETQRTAIPDGPVVYTLQRTRA